MGCTIGVSNMNESFQLYRDILGYDEIVLDQSGTFEDWSHLARGDENYRRVILKQSTPSTGGFAAATDGARRA